MHRHDPDDIGVGDIARKEGYIARQLKRWYSQWNASKTRELADVDDVHDELAPRSPNRGRRASSTVTTGSGTASRRSMGRSPLCSTGRSRRSAIRWPTSATSCTLGPNRARTVPRIACHQPIVEGYPARAELLERYAARSGRDVSQVDFYVAFSHWKSACIVEGVYARYLHGALDTTGVNVDAFKISVEMAAKRAADLLG